LGGKFFIKEKKQIPGNDKADGKCQWNVRGYGDSD
jgi:hypothetical protein